MAGGARYRIGQYRRALGAGPSPVELDAARSLLNDAQWRLFCGMSPRDRWHGIETLRLLRAQGIDDADAVVAALLHDAGKGYIHLHERVVYVLLARFPRLLAAIAEPNGRGLRGALHRSLHHAGRGAKLTLATGASQRIAELIHTHHRPDHSDPVAAALADADDRA